MVVRSRLDVKIVVYSVFCFFDVGGSFFFVELDFGSEKEVTKSSREYGV